MEGRVRDLENLVGLGQVSAGIAHEFRNSLFTILGYLRLAQRSAPPESADKIASAESEAHRLAGAVDTLLNFASPLSIRTQRMRLDELAAEVVERVAAGASDVQFRSAIAPAEVHGDRELLARAVENIVRNAVDAVRERHPDGGGIVDVSVSSDPHPKIEVRDNGVGLSSEDTARLTLPFVSAKAKGFGLGLPARAQDRAPSRRDAVVVRDCRRRRDGDDRVFSVRELFTWQPRRRSEARPPPLSCVKTAQQVLQM